MEYECERKFLSIPFLIFLPKNFIENTFFLFFLRLGIANFYSLGLIICSIFFLFLILTIVDHWFAFRPDIFSCFYYFKIRFVANSLVFAFSGRRYYINKIQRICTVHFHFKIFR